MSSNKQLWLGASGLTVLVAAIAWIFIWPGYREAAAIRRELHTLQVKMNGLQDAHHQVQQLEDQVTTLRQQVAQKYKAIPETPEVAELMRKLSLPVDGVRVVDQTFTAGSAEDLCVGQADTLRALPLKVEMTATFDSIFALVRAAESMHQLIRVSSLKIICKRDDKTSDTAPILNASVGLDAIFDPPTPPTEDR